MRYVAINKTTSQQIWGDLDYILWYIKGHQYHDADWRIYKLVEVPYERQD